MTDRCCLCLLPLTCIDNVSTTPLILSLVAREWAVVQVVPKDSKAVEDATASWVAKILRRAAKEDSGCHRESGLKLDRVWKDKNEGILFAEIVRTLPPPLRQFTPLISTLESKAMVGRFQ